jgi:hypothetical protein
MSLAKLSLGGNNLYMTSLFPLGKMVSDIPAGDGNIEKLLYGVGLKTSILILCSSSIGAEGLYLSWHFFQEQ